MKLPAEPTSRDAAVRRAQIVFVVIFAFSAAQVLWWIIDQSLYAKEVHDRWEELYAADVVAATAMLDRGARADSIERLFPHLDVDPDGAVEVSPSASAALAEERRAHVSQYAWEGAFFLAVILAGLAVVLRAVRRDAQLRRWQANFVAAVSHELKSPLASLQLAAETLEIRESSPEHRRELVRRILADAERLGTTVANVLETHRLDRDRVEPEPQALALADAVDAALAEQEFRAAAQGVTFEVDVPADLSIEADPTSVGTVLRNVLDNALKATAARSSSAGGSSAGGSSGRIELRARGAEQQVELEIRDDGVGFAPADAERLFDKFYRVGDEMRRTQPGSGLGLYLTRRLAALDGGTVTAASEGPGRGAVFTVTWARVVVREVESPRGVPLRSPT